jgi:hypothetical protein
MICRVLPRVSWIEKMTFTALKTKCAGSEWYTAIIPALRRLRQERYKFEGRVGLHSETLSQKSKQNLKSANYETKIPRQIF